MTKLNCDMGESFGIYRAGNDEEIMPLIDVANVACGFHASDPNHIRKTIELAKKHKVKVGAHPSFPDLQSFGRREMKMTKLELKNMIMYQVGALKAFLDELNMPLNHIKPHGSLYVMASKDEEIARGIADAVETFDVSIFGMANTCHEKVYKYFPLFINYLLHINTTSINQRRKHKRFCSSEGKCFTRESFNYTSEWDDRWWYLQFSHKKG